MIQEDKDKLGRSREILNELKEARGGRLLDSHRVMGNDPNLINMFLQQYVNCNKNDISIPRKYRELIVMAIGMATGTDTTMKVHANLLHVRSYETASNARNFGRPFRAGL